MMEAMQTPSLAQPAPVLPGRPPTQGEKREAHSFGDLLGELKVARVQAERGEASPQQMMKRPPETSRDQRLAELRKEYLADVERKSGFRANARQESAIEHPEHTSEGNEGWNSARHASHGPVPPIQAPIEPEVAMNDGHEAPSEHSARTKLFSTEVRSADQAGGEPGQDASKGSSAPAHANFLSSLRAVAPNAIAASEVALVLASNALTRNEPRSAPMAIATGSMSLRGGNTESNRTNETRSPQPPHRPTVSEEPKATSTATEFEKLVRLVRASSGKQSIARVLLDPPDLGRVHVRVMVEGDRVEVGVQTENETARLLLGERMHKLKAVLEQYGLAIDRFEITTHQGGLFEPRFAAGQEWLRPREWINEGSTTRNRTHVERHAESDADSAIRHEFFGVRHDDDEGFDVVG